MSHSEFPLSIAGLAAPLFAQSWTPASPKAVICLVHGHGEHSGRYAHVAEFWLESGIATYALDLPGHGKTVSKRGYTPSYEVFLDSVEALVAHAKKEMPDLPVFIFGHSMGGNIVANYLLRRKPTGIAGTILSAPWFKLAFEPPAIKVKLGRWVGKLFPGFVQHTNLDAADISRLPEEVSKYRHDPMIHDLISASMFTGVFDAGEWALAHAASWNTPLYLYHGTGDKLIAHEGSAAFAAKARGDVQLKLWEGLYHESHNEPERIEVLQAVADWVLAKS